MVKNNISKLISGEADWKNFSVIDHLKNEGNHIFKILIDQYNEQVSHLYSTGLLPEEWQKSRQFKHHRDSIRYLVTRFAIRNILSHFTFVPSTEIQFHQSVNKKPYVNGIEFNITHSGNVLLIAVSPYAIGIDVEFVSRKFGFKSLLLPCFSEREHSFIEKESDKTLKFYTLWTRKEAILKASGEGVNENMNQMDCLEDLIIHNHIDYRLKSYLIDSDYVASIATNMNMPSPTFFWNY